MGRAGCERRFCFPWGRRVSPHGCAVRFIGANTLKFSSSSSFFWRASKTEESQAMKPADASIERGWEGLPGLYQQDRANH